VPSTFRITAAIQGDGAHAHQIVPLVEQLLAVPESDRHLIARLSAEIVGPPQFGTLNSDRRAARQHLRYPALRCQRNRERCDLPARGDQLDLGHWSRAWLQLCRLDPYGEVSGLFVHVDALGTHMVSAQHSS